MVLQLIGIAIDIAIDGIVIICRFNISMRYAEDIMDNNCYDKYSHRIVLAVILIAAFILRLKNVWFAFPLQVHPDEPVLINSALVILSTGDLNPHVFYWPSLTIYLQTVLFYLVALPQKLFSVIQWPSQLIDYHICGRILNVFLSTLTIYVVYEIGKRLFNVWTGIAATLFISASSLHITNSYYATVDTPTALWSSVACLMAVMIYTKKDNHWYYIAGGISVGLAIGSKYTAFPSYLPMLIAHYCSARHDNSWFSKKLVISLLAVPITFAMTTPYAILDMDTFLNYLFFQNNAYTNHPGATSTTNYSLMNYVNYFVSDGYGVIPTVFAVSGSIALFMKSKSKLLLILCFPVALILFLGRYPVYFERNIVPLVPFISLLSGYCISQSAEFIENKLILRGSLSGSLSRIKIVVVAFAVALIYVSLQNQIQIDLKLLRENSLPDTRWVSLKWIQENLPYGAIIGREHYTPPIEEYTNRFKVTPFGHFGVVKNYNYLSLMDYVVVSDADYDRFISNSKQYPFEAQAYTNFFANHERIKEFNGDGKTLSGPRISIYRIKKA